MARRSCRGCLVAIAVCAAMPGRTLADTSAKVEAEALFQAGRDLLANGEVDEACKKFEASEKLDPGLGTMLRLADCYERGGRTASAWALFREAASEAQTSGQLGRAEIARTRADALEPKLARLELRVSEDGRVPGLELSVADVAVPEATWGVALPVDPGTPTIRAVAPGRVVWTKKVELPRGEPHLEIVDVPPLDPAPLPAEPAPERPAQAASPRAPSADTGTRALKSRTHDHDHQGDTQRIVGVVTGSIGLGALTVGGVLGIQALLKNHSSLDDCRPNDPSRCTETGVTLRRQAQANALGSTVAFTAGAVVLGSGLLVYLTSPRSGSSKPMVTAAPAVSTNAAGVLIGGAF